ncbi:hypothetical protein CC1G_04885 [Coprinopsis cinerea okayama7|uniref:Uncharacterized protein n=1 Tax=Coprinopsis cinerea (strain Okayama-7 / 130 / ATCC MYA-4618 / FGSC 9003) TaxID=240176 RepID=A8PFX7_COPC7|nr:hypothetical protein CC1G_04885 [Coprinopsis cinerea okayama7\|eukprot:XP_001841041.1 hypothetical protein CC1G_04885 [Coprinopsis cinerea okayama7\
MRTPSISFVLLGLLSGAMSHETITFYDLGGIEANYSVSAFSTDTVGFTHYVASGVQSQYAETLEPEGKVVTRSLDTPFTHVVTFQADASRVVKTGHTTVPLEPTQSRNDVQWSLECTHDVERSGSHEGEPVVCVNRAIVSRLEGGSVSTQLHTFTGTASAFAVYTSTPKHLEEDKEEHKSDVVASDSLSPASLNIITFALVLFGGTAGVLFVM